ncbi:hypothetical protein [Aneurinibacillus sp. REN35]|uniref:hypothetical protein n=1 Tax=Aneurinibacillus sp. REN35 TaxID=3237286 RepID=UPI003528C6A3
MDEHITAHKLAAGRRLHKNAREALDIIVKHSVVVPGVCWLATDTLAKNLGTCERTIRNIFARLEELRIGQRKVIEVSGMELRFFVLHPFILPDFCAEVSTDFSKHENGESVGVSTNEAAFSSAESKEPTEAKETNKDDDDLDTVFNRIADEEKLPAVERQPVLDRIKKYVASVGNIVAYVKSAIQRAIAGCQRRSNASSKQSTHKASSKPYTGAHSTFEQAKASDISRKKQRAAKANKSDILPTWVADQKRQRMEHERIAAQQAKENAMSYEEELALIRAMLT